MKPFTLLLLLLLLNSCASNQPVKYIKPTPRKEWRNLDKSDVRRVRHPEAVRTYYKGRTPTNDRLTMEEAHRVYRVENQSRWDLRPLNSPLDSAGYPTGLFDETVKVVSDNSLVSAERSRLKAMEGSLIARQTRIQMLIAELEEAKFQQDANSTNLQEMKKSLLEERRKRAELAKELAKLKKATELNAK